MLPVTHRGMEHATEDAKNKMTVPRAHWLVHTELLPSVMGHRPRSHDFRKRDKELLSWDLYSSLLPQSSKAEEALKESSIFRTRSRKRDVAMGQVQKATRCEGANCPAFPLQIFRSSSLGCLSASFASWFLSQALRPPPNHAVSSFLFK